MGQTIREYQNITIPFHTMITLDADVERHRHQYVEAFLMTKGSIEHTIGNETERLEIGDLRIIFPGTVHSFRSLGKDSLHRDYLIRPDIYEGAKNAVNQEFFDKMEKVGYAKAHLDANEIMFLEGRMSFFLVLTDIEKRKSMEKIITMYLLSLLYADAPIKVKASPFEQITIEAIAEYFNKPDAYEKIRQATGYNEKYFCQKFRSCFGMNFVTYITRKRMDYADYLLKSTSMTIEAIANEIGIESVSHFHKLYNKQFNATPGKSRK